MAETTPAEPLGLNAVKLNLRVSGTVEDAAIEDLITDAREFVESETGLVLVPRKVTETASQLGEWIDLASWPVTDVLEIRYPTPNGMVALPPNAYRFSTARRPLRILPVAYGWGVSPVSAAPGRALPVEIDVQAGYAAVTDIPRRATRAMHMLIAHYYENRQTAEVGSRAAAVEVPFGVTDLLEKLRLTVV